MLVWWARAPRIADRGAQQLGLPRHPSLDEGAAALLRSGWLLMLPPLTCSTQQLAPAPTLPALPGACSEPVRFHLGNINSSHQAYVLFA